MGWEKQIGVERGEGEKEGDRARARGREKRDKGEERG